VGQLDPLGVDQQHPHLLRRGAHHDRGDHRVHEAGLARSGRAGHQQVRHLGQVRDDIAALDVLAQPDGQRVVVVAGAVGAEHVAEGDDLLVGIRDLDADRGLAGDRREDAHFGRRHGVRDVLGQSRDLLDLHAVAEFDLVAGDGRAAGVAGDGCVDLELLQHLGEAAHDEVAGAGAGLGYRPGLEDRLVRELVDDVATERHLFGAQRCRRHLRHGQRLGDGDLGPCSGPTRRLGLGGERDRDLLVRVGVVDDRGVVGAVVGPVGDLALGTVEAFGDRGGVPSHLAERDAEDHHHAQHRQDHQDRDGQPHPHQVDQHRGGDEAQEASGVADGRRLTAAREPLGDVDHAEDAEQSGRPPDKLAAGRPVPLGVAERAPRHREGEDGHGVGERPDERGDADG